MKFSWRDLVNTALLAAGTVLVYANLQNYDWTWVNNWRFTAAALGVIGIAMCITAAGDLENKSILNRLEIWLGSAVGLVLVFAVITGWQWVVMTAAVTIGVLWLISTTRHIRHSLMHETPTMHHGAYVH